MPTSKYYFLVNLLIYQVCWFACVLSAANGMPWISVVIVAVAVAHHLYISSQPAVELKLIVVVTIIGSVWDSALVARGLLEYPSGMFINGVAPYWIISLWAAFAITLNVSLTWLKKHIWVAFLLGAIGGPLVFFTAEKMGALQFSDMTLALGVLAVGWTLLMPLIVKLSQYWSGFDTAASILPVSSSQFLSKSSSRVN